MNIKITADSTCDLSPELVEKYGVGIFPLSVVKDGVPMRDGIDITPDDIFAYVAAGGKPCGTTAVNMADYGDRFAEYRKEYDAVIHFTISSDMSTCYQNAAMAAEQLSEVYVVDSRNLSTGIGQLVIDAAIMARDGTAPADIKAALDEKKKRLDVSFVLDTLDYLRRGGRCSAVAAFGANLLSLRPCIEVRDGAMGVGKKYRGNLEKCILKYIDDRLMGSDNVEYERIFMTDSGLPAQVLDDIEAEIRKCGPFREVLRTRAGCTISNHCGPNCFGILYYRKKA